MANYGEISIKQPDLVKKSFWRTKVIPQPDRVLGLLFDSYAWVLWWENSKKDGKSIPTTAQMKFVCEMCFYAAQSWCRSNGIVVDFSREDVKQCFDGISAVKLNEIVMIMTASVKAFMPLAQGQKISGLKFDHGKFVN